jgi:dimethylhistidine N-methyltransferase
MMPLDRARGVDPDFLADVLAGLARPDKHLPCKYFYDERGSRLFDRICELPEYYPTRCELAILRRDAAEMVGRFPPGAALVEYGSGSGLKTRLLLEQLGEGTYYPVDISREHLLQSARRLAREFLHIDVVPVCADFTKPFMLPRAARLPRQRVVYFSGSTISNFGPPEAVGLLRQIARLIGPGGGLLIGVDLRKDRAILEPAYDDAAGVTAAFNLNLLARVNRELGGDFALDRFRHHAFWNEQHGRIEIHLVSLEQQVVTVAGRRFPLAAGETICTEYSYKFSVEEFARLAEAAGLDVREVWRDAAGLFSVQYAQR